MSKEQTASFMIRFSQKQYLDDKGTEAVQWRGKISHVQSGEDTNFVDFDKAADFMQRRLSLITQSTVSEEAATEQEGILTKSFDMLKRIRQQAPAFVMDTIKDPLGQVENIQDQIKEQLRDVGGDLSQKLDVDNIRTASRNDYKEMVTIMKSMAAQIDALAKKVDRIDKKK